MTSPEGKPYIVGDIGDFLNYCVKFTLKFGSISAHTGVRSLNGVNRVPFAYP